MPLSPREKEKQKESLKTHLLKTAHGIKIVNKMMKVSGQRIRLDLADRSIDAVYYPALDDNGAKIKEKAPLIAGFHGGGFLFGGCALDDLMWVAVTKALHCNVVSVGYRQSPKHRWKDTLQDAADSVNYLNLHAGDFSSFPDSISVMGQSAGANLAAAVALKFNLDRMHMSPGEEFDNITLGDFPMAQIQNCILLYPLLDCATDPDSKSPGSLSGPVCHIFNELHCSDGNEKNPLVSPSFVSKSMLRGLPNTIIVYSENDNLRQEAIKYAKMLKEAGIPVAKMLAENMPHGYFESGFKTPTAFEMQFLGENGQELAESGKLFESAAKTLIFIKENLKI